MEFNDTLTNLSEPDGRVPSSRISDPAQARAMVNKVILDGEKRAKVNALVKGLVDGNPPYSQASLDKDGQKYRANFNTGEGLSFLTVSLTAFYDLFSETPTYATVVGESKDGRGSEYSSIVTEEFDWLQRTDDSMDFGVQLSNHDMVLFGSGPHTWDGVDDWKSRPVRHTDFFLPNHTSSNLEDFEWCALRYTLTPSQLYRYIRNEEAAAEAGWDVPSVRSAIMSAGRGAVGFADPDQWVHHQQRLRNNDLAYTSQSEVVKVARVLYREFPDEDSEKGKISECWIVLDKATTAHDEGDSFLFRRLRRYDSWKNVLCPFFYDKGDGTAHSVKGLGVRMYKLLVTKMRLANALTDAAFARSALMFKTPSARDAEAASIVNFGPYVYIPDNVELVPVNAGGVLDAPMAMERELGNTLTANLAQFRQRMDKPEGNPRTATEVQNQVQQQSVLGKTQISRYYEQLDAWYAERFRRAVELNVEGLPSGKDVAEFKRRLSSRGVPPAFLKTCTVKATRTVGQGSTFLRSQVLDSMLMTVGGSLPEAGRKNLIRDDIAAKAGQHMVERYYPMVGDMTPTEQEQRAEAMQENAMFKLGAPVMITDLQDDYIHAFTHLEGAVQALNSVQQGADPADALFYIDNNASHMVLHMQRLSDDSVRKQEFEVLQKQFLELSRAADQLRAFAKESLQQSQQQQPSLSAEDQIKLQKAELDGRIKQAKASQLLRQKEEKFEQDKVINDAKAAADIARKSRKEKV